MNILSELKGQLVYFLEKTNIGQAIVFFVKKKLGKLPAIDLNFPTSVHLEISSLCNLSCIHCPSHLPQYKEWGKTHGIMQLGLFNRAMDEIDQRGVTRLALHKDGEPLLHPEINTILNRVKKNQTHYVTLITNGHLLTDEVADAILDNHIDSIIFSIGAASASFYEKVRGKGYEKVLDNISSFLNKREEFHHKPAITVQIINLPEFPEMKTEIEKFKQFWKGKPVKVMVFEELNWGVFDTCEASIDRYPCPSLWRNLFVHWDGKVSPCCMDWNQSLTLGNLNNQSLAEIWTGEKIKDFRKAHLKNEFAALPLCGNCNYWCTVTRLEEKCI